MTSVSPLHSLVESTLKTSLSAPVLACADVVGFRRTETSSARDYALIYTRDVLLLKKVSSSAFNSSATLTYENPKCLGYAPKGLDRRPLAFYRQDVENNSKRNNVVLKSHTKYTFDVPCSELVFLVDVPHRAAPQRATIVCEFLNTSKATEILRRIQTSSATPATECTKMLKRTSSSANSARLSEILDTERTYFEGLSMLSYDFRLPMRDASVLLSCLDPRDVELIFGNLDDLIRVSEELMENWRSCDSAKSFFEMFDLTKTQKAFELYSATYTQAGAHLAASRKKYSVLDEFVSELETRAKVPLNQLLITPVQRVMRYGMLFDAAGAATEAAALHKLAKRVDVNSPQVSNGNLCDDRRVVKRMEDVAAENSKCLGGPIASNDRALLHRFVGGNLKLSTERITTNSSTVDSVAKDCIVYLCTDVLLISLLSPTQQHTIAASFTYDEIKSYDISHGVVMTIETTWDSNGEVPVRTILRVTCDSLEEIKSALDYRYEMLEAQKALALEKLLTSKRNDVDAALVADRFCKLCEMNALDCIRDKPRVGKPASGYKARFKSPLRAASPSRRGGRASPSPLRGVVGRLRPASPMRSARPSSPLNVRKTPSRRPSSSEVATAPNARTATTPSRPARPSTVRRPNTTRSAVRLNRPSISQPLLRQISEFFDDIDVAYEGRAEFVQLRSSMEGTTFDKQMAIKTALNVIHQLRDVSRSLDDDARFETSLLELIKRIVKECPESSEAIKRLKQRASSLDMLVKIVSIRFKNAKNLRVDFLEDPSCVYVCSHSCADYYFLLTSTRFVFTKRGAETIHEGSSSSLVLRGDVLRTPEGEALDLTRDFPEAKKVRLESFLMKK